MTAVIIITISFSILLYLGALCKSGADDRVENDKAQLEFISEWKEKNNK